MELRESDGRKKINGNRSQPQSNKNCGPLREDPLLGSEDYSATPVCVLSSLKLDMVSFRLSKKKRRPSQTCKTLLKCGENG